jgi:predicted NACHT family NTPase
MAARSLQVSSEEIETAQKALTDRCLTHKELAKELKISRQTVGKFFRGEPVDRQYFVQICEELRLEWDEIATKAAREPKFKAKKQDSGSDIDELVQKVRALCREKIQYQCGTMQMLDVSHPVELDNLYVDVNILEDIPSQRWLDISKRLQDFDPSADDFDRFYLGEVHQPRVPGLEAAQKNSKLMVLGKPGAGKTTFLKHLAIECNKGKFQADRVPIFVGLKRFAENIRNTTNVWEKSLAPLHTYINQDLEICDIAAADVDSLLKHGRALILLDGLDEVSEQDSEVVQQQIIWLCERYFKNQFVISCRTQAQKYRFERFAYVEVADFNQNQIEAFAKKWFVGVSRNSSQKGLVKADEFIQKLKHQENQRLRELAITPILLNLTCLVFSDLEYLPTNRAKLYEQGLDILFRRWDKSRGIRRDEVYRDLLLPHKIELLSQVAAITFEQGDYFFEQDKIQQLIVSYLRTLLGVQIDPEVLQLDSETMLKAIESQHGLLIERARKIYSFSHLTFQEYFTARRFVTSSAPQDIENLVSHIAEVRWREVFLLAAEICQNADNLLLRMKQKIDALIATDKRYQEFLIWSSEKSRLAKAPYKAAAIRAFYHASILNYLQPSRLAFSLGCEVKKAHNFSIDFALDLALLNIVPFAEFISLSTVEKLKVEITHAVDLVHAIDPLLEQELQQLKDELPDLDKNTEEAREWMESNSLNWSHRLKNVMILHRNIGHDWQLSTQPSEAIQQYYNANKLLVECLNCNCKVTLAVRQEIEDTLLLSIAEIEKRNK